MHRVQPQTLCCPLPLSHTSPSAACFGNVYVFTRRPRKSVVVVPQCPDWLEALKRLPSLRRSPHKGLVFKRVLTAIGLLLKMFFCENQPTIYKLSGGTMTTLVLVVRRTLGSEPNSSSKGIMWKPPWNDFFPCQYSLCCDRWNILLSS